MQKSVAFHLEAMPDSIGMLHAPIPAPTGEDAMAKTLKDHIEEKDKFEQAQKEAAKTFNENYNKAIRESATSAFDDLKKQLEVVNGIFNTAQKRELIKVLGMKASGRASKSAGRSANPDGTTTKPVAKKFEVDGVQWSGRGTPPKEFTAWNAKPAGIAWRKNNPNAGERDYPLIGSAESTAKTSGAGAKKPAKGDGKATAKAN